SASRAVTFSSRRPKPTRSGNPGCAPTATPLAFARRIVSRSTDGSPAWKPAATFAEVIDCIRLASWPIEYAPNDSPTSELISILMTVTRWVRCVLFGLRLGRFGRPRARHRQADALPERLDLPLDFVPAVYFEVENRLIPLQ